MARTSPFSSLFNLRKKHIEQSFANAKHCASIHGIKILRAPLPEEGPASILVVPTRQCKGIVLRNKLRRQIKAIIYEEKLFEQHGTFIVLLYDRAKQLSYDEIKKFLVKAMGTKE